MNLYHSDKYLAATLSQDFDLRQAIHIAGQRSDAAVHLQFEQDVRELLHTQLRHFGELVDM